MERNAAQPVNPVGSASADRLFVSRRENNRSAEADRTADVTGDPRAATKAGLLRKWARDFHNDAGGAAVAFIIAFPLFLWIIAIVIQFVLIVNAKVMVDYAAQAAARAAVTSLPEGQPDNVNAAACLALTPLSPQATDAVAAQADSTYQALLGLGVQAPPSFPPRYTYAMAATTTTWNPQMDFTTHTGQIIDVTLLYRFKLTVPGAMGIIGVAANVAGVDGRFLDIRSTRQVCTSHGRAANSDGSGFPQ